MQAAYSGQNPSSPGGFFVSSASTTVNVTASGVAKTSTTLTANPTTVAIDGALQLTAAVQSATAGTLAGNVTFTIGSTTVGTAAITPGASGAGSATLSVASATTALGFAVGSNTVVATYGGDANYSSSSGSATVTITNPGITIQATNVTISASPGNTGTSTITLTSTGGYAGTANVSATGSVECRCYLPQWSGDGNGRSVFRWHGHHDAHHHHHLCERKYSKESCGQPFVGSPYCSRGWNSSWLYPLAAHSRYPAKEMACGPDHARVPERGCRARLRRRRGWCCSDWELHHYRHRGGQQQHQHHCFHHIHSHPPVNNFAVKGRLLKRRPFFWADVLR